MSGVLKLTVWGDILGLGLFVFEIMALGRHGVALCFMHDIKVV